MDIRRDAERRRMLLASTDVQSSRSSALLRFGWSELSRTLEIAGHDFFSEKPGASESSPPSPDQFDNPFLGIARGRRRHPRVKPRGCARRFSRKLGVSHADRHCLPLRDEEKPMAAKPSRRHSESAQRVSEGPRKRRARLGCRAQRNEHSTSPVPAKARMQRAAPLCPHLQNRKFVVAQLKMRSKSFGSCG